MGREQLVEQAMDFGSDCLRLVKSPGCPAWPAKVMAGWRKPDGAKALNKGRLPGGSASVNPLGGNAIGRRRCGFLFSCSFCRAGLVGEKACLSLPPESPTRARGGPCSSTG